MTRRCTRKKQRNLLKTKGKPDNSGKNKMKVSLQESDDEILDDCELQSVNCSTMDGAIESHGQTSAEGKPRPVSSGKLVEVKVSSGNVDLFLNFMGPRRPATKDADPKSNFSFQDVQRLPKPILTGVHENVESEPKFLTGALEQLKSEYSQLGDSDTPPSPCMEPVGGDSAIKENSPFMELGGGDSAAVEERLIREFDRFASPVRVDSANKQSSPFMELNGGGLAADEEHFESYASALTVNILTLWRAARQQWQEKMKSLSSRISVKEEEIVLLKLKNKKSQESIVQHKAQVIKVGRYEKMLHELKSEVLDLRENVPGRIKGACEKMGGDFQNAFDEFSRERERLIAELSDCQEKFKTANNDAKMRKQEIGQMKSKLDSMAEMCTTLELKKCKIEQQMKSKLDSMAEMCTTLELKKCKIEQQLKSASDEVKAKKLEMEKMNASLSDIKHAYTKLEHKNTKIEQQLCEMLAGRDGSYADGLPTPFLLESAAKDMFSSIGRFAKLYHGYVKASRNLNPQGEIEFVRFSEKFYLARPAHSIFLLKGFISGVLLHGFEKESFDSFCYDSGSLFQDDNDRVRSCFGYFQRSRDRVQPGPECPGGSFDKHFDCQFRKYLYWKLSLLRLDEVNELVAAFNDHGELVNDPFTICNARLNLVQSFIVAAKKTWDLHKLCLSFAIPATIFSASSGDTYDTSCMDCSVGLEEDSKFVSKVGFVVCPGFRLRKSVIKCEVYFGVNS